MTDKLARGSAMTDKGLEAPDADAAEQEQDAIPELEDDDELEELEEFPLEANEADTAEQAREVSLDDDDYR
jgi:hypothetical protein